MVGKTPFSNNNKKYAPKKYLRKKDMGLNDEVSISHSKMHTNESCFYFLFFSDVGSSAYLPCSE